MVEFSSNMKFFKLYLTGREAKSWGNIKSFRFVTSQSTAKIFLAPDHTGGIHNALMTWTVDPHKSSFHHYIFMLPIHHLWYLVSYQ